MTEPSTRIVVSGAPTVKAASSDAWNPQREFRFRELARSEALRELSIDELAELEALSRLRRHAKNPRTADEILWQRKQSKLTRDLVQALQAYIGFHEITGATKA